MMSDHDLIRRGDALNAVALCSADSDSPNAHFVCRQAYKAIAALPAVTAPQGVEAALILAKEMQAIVAADRWKGRDLSTEPPEKWSHLRPETQQFWIDTATRILANLKGPKA